jgi:hypothetical protein
MMTLGKGIVLLLLRARSISIPKVVGDFEYDLATLRRSDGPEV